MFLFVKEPSSQSNHSRPAAHLTLTKVVECARRARLNSAHCVDSREHRSV